MFCRFCGNELPEGANFCPKCGKINEVEEATVNENAGAEIPETPVMDATESVNVFEEEKSSLAGKILTFGILGLAFAVSFWLSFMGIIFSAIAKAKVGEYVAKFGETEGRASVGKGLATGGLIAGIILTVLFFLYIIVLAAAIAVSL